MLHSLKDIGGFELAVRDGTIGRVREIYFDDRYWVARHIVVDTGGWLSDRRVLISPHSIEGIDRDAKRVAVALTREQIEKAPTIDTDKPVSRQYEIAAYDFYGYPYYWGGTGLWGMMDLPMGAMAPVAGATTLGPATTDAESAEAARASADAERAHADPHLRSSGEVSGYDVTASDGDIGHVDDFLIDSESWRIALVVIDTHNWLPDRLVLVPPEVVTGVDWTGRRVSVRISRQAVKDSPPYERSHRVERETVTSVQRHFESSE